jgi:hypothetical protein
VAEAIQMEHERDWEWWAKALQDRYFSRAFAGEPVTLSVDRDELASIAGCEPGAAVGSLAEAVRAQVMPSYRFARAKESMQRWFRTVSEDLVSDLPPPALPLLALNVLAASEMTNHGGQGAPSFYGPLRQYLYPGDIGEGAPGDYSESVPECWELLSQWLDELLAGGRGFSTIERHETFVNIGYATQQAVLRTSDRRRLARFFRAIGLQPGEEDVVPSELLQALRVWSKRQGPAGTRLLRLATDPGHRKYAERLLPILAKRWDGMIRNERTGAPGAPLRLLVQRHPWNLGLVALWNDALPATGQLNVGDSEDLIDVVAVTSGVYEPTPLPIEVTRQTLDDGLKLESDDLALYLESADAYAFRQSEEVHPDWVSTSTVRFGERHLLLVRRQFREATERWLESEGCGGELAPAATQHMPADWFLFHGIRIDSYPTHEPPPPIADLLRVSGGTRFRLIGGLKIPGFQRAYLVGGAPMLALPSDARDSFDLSLDGSGTHTLSATDNQFPIHELARWEGEYRIDHEQVSLSFDVVETWNEKPGPQVGSVSHVSGTTQAVSGLTAEVVQPRDPSVVTVEGVAGEMVVGAGGQVQPVLLPLWLLTDIEDVRWTTADVWGEFEPVWALSPTESGQHVARVSALIPPTPDAQIQGLKRVAQATLPEEQSDEAFDLWCRYEEAADVR